MRFVLLLFLPLCRAGKERNGSDKDSIALLMNVSADMMHDTDERIEKLQLIKVNTRFSMAYEVGYVIKVMQEILRKQVDKYNVSLTFFDQLIVGDLLLYLEDIEHLYWEMEHLAGMVHEIENKYDQRGGLAGDYVEFKPDDFTTTTKKKKKRKKSRTTRIPRNRTYANGRPKPKRKRTKLPPEEKEALNEYFENLAKQHMSTTRRRTQRWWSIDYGWEIDYKW